MARGVVLPPAVLFLDVARAARTGRRWAYVKEKNPANDRSQMKRSFAQRRAKCTHMGFICQVEPAGSVPSETKVELRVMVVPLPRCRRESRANGRGVF